MQVVGSNGIVAHWIIGDVSGRHVQFKRKHSHAHGMSEDVMIGGTEDGASIRFEMFGSLRTSIKFTDAKVDGEEVITGYSSKWKYHPVLRCNGTLTWQSVD